MKVEFKSRRIGKTELGCQQLKVEGYPVSPRLSPEGDGWICDRCNRRWRLGETSGCAACIAAIDAQQRHPATGIGE